MGTFGTKTLGDFVEDVWRPESQRLRECTRAGYESAYRLHICTQLGGADLSDLTPMLLDRWLAGMPSPGAARKSWALLRSMLRLAVRRGLLAQDPTVRVTVRPAPTGYQPAVLTARQARTLLQGFYGHELEAWLLCSLCAGLRRCESVGLEWRDIVVYSSNDSNLNGGYVVHPDGRIRLYGMVAPSRFVLCNGSWITGDPMPEA